MRERRKCQWKYWNIFLTKFTDPCIICYIAHVKILLSLLFCLIIIVLLFYQPVNVFLFATPVHSRVNLVHFKAAHLDPHETYIVKLTCWPWWTSYCLLQLNHIIQKAFLAHKAPLRYNVPWNIYDEKRPFLSNAFYLKYNYSLHFCKILT